ncbi:hypothetical protein BIV57_02075 [Mangrovactinospora gilvigrisea]|uniref:Uncharacterized protein n=1 Tax=Mangrovactinospora gilvigrisea TaxID=1428644 RepID=A0A1J7BKL5_9ACTN|nr:hypothetical protein [Mangrovactinospora gilvigrisea]OIV39141.1 hypothetical protein BIV57_02075 [Mangrovactinospora gilvigrisea]
MPRSANLDRTGGLTPQERDAARAAASKQREEELSQQAAEFAQQMGESGTIHDQALLAAQQARVEASQNMDQALANATAKQRRQVTDEARQAEAEAVALTAYEEATGASILVTNPEVLEAYNKLQAATERAANRPVEEFQAEVSEGQRDAVKDKFWRGYAYVGTSIEDAIAADPEIANDPRITRLGAAQRGIRVPDFLIQAPEAQPGDPDYDPNRPRVPAYAVDITGGSKTSVREHRNREYITGTRLYHDPDQVVTYRTRTVGEIKDIFRRQE